MGYFRVEGVGSQASEPVERIVPTAREAESERNVLQRLCGKRGRVVVRGKDGREISPERLRRMARSEEAAHGPDGEGADA